MIKLTPNGVNTATSYGFTVEIIERLCKEYCVNATPSPVVTKTYSVVETELVGEQLYGKIQCLVNIAYKPVKGCQCSLTTNAYVETFEVSFSGATATSTISVIPTSGYTEPYYVNGACSKANGVRDCSIVSITMS